MSKKKKQEEEVKQPESKEKDEKEPQNRNVYIFGRLDNEIAVPVIRRLLRLAERDSERPINLYINSSGGNGYNADAIIAIMHSIDPVVNTICLGHALSGACEILASGTGHRSAYEFSTLMFHQTIWEAEGDITNLEIQAAQGQRFRVAQIELLHRCTGQSRDTIRKDIERDFYMSAQDAIKYGIIDSIIKHKKKGTQAKASAVRTTRAKSEKTHGGRTKPGAKTAAKARARSSKTSRKK